MTPTGEIKKAVVWLAPFFVAMALAIPLRANVSPVGSASVAKAAPAFHGGNDLIWAQVANQPGVFWYTIYFPTPSVGYALGGPDWNADDPRGPGYLAKTNDGGTTWTITQIPGTNLFMRGLACTDAEHCWISGASTNKIMFTADGGATWQNGIIANNAWNGWLWSTGWTHQGTTIMMGTTGYANVSGRRASFLRAADGYNFEAVIANDPREFVVWDFSCPSPGVCYAAAKDTAFYTFNDGVNWIRRVLPNARYYGINCTDITTCWEVGGSNGVTTDGFIHIYRTTDGGVNWQQSNSPPLTNSRPRLYNVQMADAQHGYAVGCTNAPDPILEVCEGSGLIMQTDDGVTWRQIPSPSSADLMDLWVHSMTEVIIVDFAGKIWRGSGGTPTPTPTNTPTSTPTATNTPTRTATSTKTHTPTITPSVTFSPTSTETWTPIPSATPTQSPTVVRALYVPALVKASTSTPRPTSTPTPTPTMTPLAPVVNGGFEAGLLGWVSGGSYAPPQVRTDVVHSGLRSVVLGNPNRPCTSSTDPRRGDSWVALGIQVPNTVAPQLVVWYRVLTWDRNRALSDAFDRFEIWLNSSRVHRDANTTVEPDCGQPPTDLGWKQFIYDLSAYRGQQVMLKLTNIVWPDEAYNTWTYVDDVSVVP